MEVRSYRAVFEIERRIYRLDRLRLNPGGVPVRGVVYFLALALAAGVLSVLPLAGAPLGVVPWYVRELVLPGAAAALFTVLRVDGRPCHLAVLALLRDAGAPRRCGGAGNVLPSRDCWRPEPLLVLPDGSDARLRRLRYCGPGAIVVGAAHRREEWRTGWRGRLSGAPHVVLRGLPDRRLTRAQRIVLADGARLRVR